MPFRPLASAAATTTTAARRGSALRGGVPSSTLHSRMPPAVSRVLACLPAAAFSASAPVHRKAPMPPRPPPPPEDEIDEMFVKGTGPGGQKILRHIPTGIVVKSQATRSRTQNRAIARALLAARLDELHNGAASRTAVVAADKVKRATNAAKKARRKYRKLAESKAGGRGAGGEEGEGDVDEEGGEVRREEEGEEEAVGNEKEEGGRGEQGR